MQIASFITGTLWPAFRSVLGYLIDHWQHVATVIWPVYSILFQLGKAIARGEFLAG